MARRHCPHDGAAAQAQQQTGGGCVACAAIGGRGGRCIRRVRGARRVGVPTGGVLVTRVGSNVGGSLGRVAVAETISVGVRVGVSPPSLGNGVVRAASCRQGAASA